MNALTRGLVAALTVAVVAAPVAAEAGVGAEHGPAAAHGASHGKPHGKKPGKPVVKKVKPNKGPTGGGTRVVIRGKRFIGTKRVMFGGQRGLGLDVRGGGKIVVHAPPHAPGRVDVRVVGKHGKSRKVRGDRFTYQAPPVPTVIGISPTSGSSAGGTAVTVLGTNFVGVPTVTFGGTPGTSVSVASSGQLTVTSPAHAVGPADVRVTTTYGTSPTGPGDVFTYNATVPPGLAGLDAPLPPGAAANPDVGLTSVACSATAECMAVGRFAKTGQGYRPLAERLTAGQWLPAELPLPVDAVTTSDNSRRLSSVTCPTTTLCLAVGNYLSTSGPRPLLEKWDGTTWTNLTVSTPTASSVLVREVTCASATACYAVGVLTANGLDAPLVLTWNGTGWTAALAPLPSGGAAGMLTAVACLSATDCAGVGNYSLSATAKAPLAVDIGGATLASHAIVLPADSRPSPNATLSAVSCVAGQRCTAVGSYASVDGVGQVNGRKVLTSSRVGSGAWGNAVAVPLPADAATTGSTQQADLTDVSCAATTCLATGHYVTTANQSRAMVSTLPPGALGSVVIPTAGALPADSEELIDCAGPGGCASVGGDVVSAKTVAFLDAITGGAPQSAVQSPAPVGATTSNLNGLAVLPGATTGVSVGQYKTGSQTRGLLVTGVPVG